MTPNTPVEDPSPKFSCPTPACCLFNQIGQGNIVHRSWTGKHKHLERLRCTECGREFSEREGTLMEPSKLSEEQGERLVKCQRWGGWDEGTADLCEVDIKTVPRFQKGASQRAETHHRQGGRDVPVEGVQLDEAHSKLRGGIKAWIHTPLAIGSLFLLWGDVGPRTQEMAAGMLAQGVARVQKLPMVFPDGWKAYPCCVAARSGRDLSSSSSREGGEKAQATPGGSQSLVLCAGGQDAQCRSPGSGRGYPRDLWGASPLFHTDASSDPGHDHQSGLYGTMGWHHARTHSPLASPQSVSVVECFSTPGTPVAVGGSVQLREAPQKPATGKPAAHPCHGHRTARACVALARGYVDSCASG